MNDTTITLELPRIHGFQSAPAQLALLPARLENITQRNLDAQTTAGLFAFVIAMFAILTAFGIAG